MKKFLEKNKDKIFIWVCVGLIAIIVLLFVIFQRNDVEQMNDNKSDINIIYDDNNLNKNDISWYSFVVSYGDTQTFRINHCSESTFIVNENDNLTYNNWYMDFYFINFDCTELLNVVNNYYGSDLVPSNLYFNFTFYASVSSSDVALDEYFGPIFTYSYLYFPSDYNYNNDFPSLSNSNLITFVNNSNFSYFDYTLSSDGVSYSNDYVGYCLSIPLDFSKDYFNIVLPKYDFINYDTTSNDYFLYWYAFDDSNGVISDKNFLNSDNFTDLQNRYNTLYSNYSVYVTNHSYNDTQYSQLEATNTQLSNTNSQLEATNTQLSNTNSQLEATNTQLSNINSQLQSDYNSLDANYNTLLSQYNTLLNQTEYSFSELFWSISAVPMGVLTSAFNVNVLGVNLRGIITGLFTALLLIWLFKKLF